MLIKKKKKDFKVFPSLKTIQNQSLTASGQTN